MGPVAARMPNFMGAGDGPGTLQGEHSLYRFDTVLHLYDASSSNQPTPYYVLFDITIVLVALLSSRDDPRELWIGF